MPGHGGTHPSAGLQRTPHSCQKTVRGKLLHSPSCACQGPVSFYGDDRCGWLDNASPPVCPAVRKSGPLPIRHCRWCSPADPYRPGTRILGHEPRRCLDDERRTPSIEISNRAASASSLGPPRSSTSTTGVKPARSRGRSSASGMLQPGQGMPAPPQPHALGPSHGMAG
jgi:hypothetical protein